MRISGSDYFKRVVNCNTVDSALPSPSSMGKVKSKSKKVPVKTFSSIFRQSQTLHISARFVRLIK